MIGAHIMDELKSAGLAGLVQGVNLTTGHVALTVAATASDRNAVQAIIDAHDPDDPRPVEIAQAKVDLAASDKQMARFAEDLFDALVFKGILHESDLPNIAIVTVSERKNMRAILKR